MVTSGPAPATVTIKSAEAQGSAIVITQPAISTALHEGGCLVFHRYGSAYFLSELWNPGSYGQRLSTSKWEREVAASRTAPNTVVVAALR